MQVIYEDNHIIAVNKNCSEIVQGDQTGDTPLSEIVKAYIKEKYQKPGNVFVGIIHRIDRPTSGVVLFARTSKALARLDEMFAQKEKIHKTYWAVVDRIPIPESGSLHHWLVRNVQKNKSQAYNTEMPNSQEAFLNYKLLCSSDKYHLLEIDLITGRHHQIRAQLATIGCHIKGDLKYGSPRSNPGGGIHLHARKIELIHPVSKELISITASVPDESLWKFFEEKVTHK
ncbi:MAG TPA: RNA pseudouridine synthase [Prolixibacteraceae bacterium]|nr:RNA pseudouridine synthase [Prolixibacteraceae bacterium]HPS12257.1 RNA pseudouridine synthase [Prolixibacteraceae bacterium]